MHEVEKAKNKSELLRVITEEDREFSESRNEPCTPLSSRLVTKQNWRRMRKRKPLLPKLEMELVHIIKEQHEKGIAVAHLTIKIKAR